MPPQHPQLTCEEKTIEESREKVSSAVAEEKTSEEKTSPLETAAAGRFSGVAAPPRGFLRYACAEPQ